MQQKEITLRSKNSSFVLDQFNYADKAEQIVHEESIASGHGKLFGGLTRTKLRGIYALIANVSVRATSHEDFKNYLPDIKYLKVRMAYAAGRDKYVKNFLEKTHLMDFVSDVHDSDQFRLYCRYAESLVAYFKYYGGED